MNKFFKPASLLFYFLTLLLFFLLGSTIASYSGVADNQGLAAAAIVIGYGVITAVIMLVVAIISVAYLSLQKIVNLNKILGILLVLMIGILVARGIMRKKKTDTIEQLSPKNNTLRIRPLCHANPVNTSSVSIGSCR